MQEHDSQRGEGLIFGGVWFMQYTTEVQYRSEAT